MLEKIKEFFRGLGDGDIEEVKAATNSALHEMHLDQLLRGGHVSADPVHQALAGELLKTHGSAFVDMMKASGKLPVAESFSTLAVNTADPIEDSIQAHMAANSTDYVTAANAIARS